MNVTHTRFVRLIGAVAAISLIAPACGAGDDDAADDVAEPADGDAAAADAAAADAVATEVAGEWVAVEGSIAGEPVTLLPAGPITIEIEADGDVLLVNGRAACNAYGGSATFDADGGLSFGDLAVTEMGCVDTAVMQLERVYVGSLAELDRWELDGETLVLSGGEAEWSFAREVPMPTVDVFAVTWVLESRIEGEVASNAIGFDAVVLRLADDETFEGATGCSAFTGGWEERGEGAGVATFEIIADPDGCGDSARELESFVVSVFDRMPDLIADEDRLTLEVDDKRALVFRAMPAEDPDEPAADEPTDPVGLSPVSVRPVLACGEESLEVEADIVQVDPAQQLDCALGPPISDGPVFAADAEAVPGPTGQWQVSVRIAERARGDWDAAATECFERGAECPTGQLAIVANGAIASAPLVQTPTFPGELVISGAFTESDARSIAASINAAG